MKRLPGDMTKAYKFDVPDSTVIAMHVVNFCDNVL